MIWLEMVSIRTAGSLESGRILEICRECCRSISSGELLKVTVYSNTRYESDVSIHLQWRSDPGPWSILGREIISALSDLGLISHTFWVEQENFPADAQSKIVLGNTTSDMNLLR
ncbi:MAG: hypothetical protein AB9866_17825 [Syntrophobacteraceae bacterium]